MLFINVYLPYHLQYHLSFFLHSSRRNSRQVKTRAQTTKKAHGSNYGNFSELDEYLKKHPNFWMNWADINAQEDLSVRRGNAIDLEDHVNSQGILFNTTCIDDPTGLEDDFSTNWVKLSHIVSVHLIDEFSYAALDM